MDLSSNSSQVNLLSFAFCKHLLTAIQILYHHHCTITQLPTFQGSDHPQQCILLRPDFLAQAVKKNDWFFGLLFFWGGRGKKWDPAIFFSPRFQKKQRIQTLTPLFGGALLYLLSAVCFTEYLDIKSWMLFPMRLLKNAEHQGFNALVVEFHPLLPNLPPFDPILIIFDRQRCFNMFSSSKTGALWYPPIKEFDGCPSFVHP